MAVQASLAGFSLLWKYLLFLEFANRNTLIDRKIKVSRFQKTRMEMQQMNMKLARTLKTE